MKPDGCACAATAERQGGLTNDGKQTNLEAAVKLTRCRKTELAESERITGTGSELVTKNVKRRIEKNIFEKPAVFCFLLNPPNNQDKGPTRRMITRLNLMFPRRSP